MPTQSGSSVQIVQSPTCLRLALFSSHSPLLSSLKASTLTNIADDPDFQPLFPGIPKDAISTTCKWLKLSISADIDDDGLRIQLDFVWFNVNQLLKQDPSPKQPLASLDEFKANVDKRGEDLIFRLLRDTADDVRISGSMTRWAPLFLDGVFYSARVHQMPYVTESSLNASVHP